MTTHKEALMGGQLGRTGIGGRPRTLRTPADL